MPPSSAASPCSVAGSHPRGFAAATSVASATSGPLLPTSIPVIFCALVAKASPGAMPLGGLVPAGLMTVAPLSWHLSPTGFLLCVNGLIPALAIFLGHLPGPSSWAIFLNGEAILLVIVPLLIPVAGQIGIDPVHFGIVVVLSGPAML